jgi:hypothetical protein
VLHSGNGNTDANSFLNADGTVPADRSVPFFANVGSSPSGGASVTYLGAGWILTANHVSFSDLNKTVSLGGSSYTVETDSNGHIVPHVLTNSDHSTADLKLFHLTTSPGLPSLISLIDNASPSAGSRLIMIGNGLSSTSAQTYWDDSTVPWLTEAAPIPPTVDDHSGYFVGSSQVMRWGDNKVLNNDVLDPATGTSTFTTNFDDAAYTHSTPLASEAQATSGDSGGAVFSLIGSQWELSGLMINTFQPGSQPGSTAMFGNLTYMADLSAYRTEILAIVPEPSGAALAWTAAATLAVLWRRRKGRIPPR